MKCNSRILFILLLIVMIFSITAVSAAENHTQVKNVADHESVNNMEILGISSNDNIISASDNGKFSDLKNKIDNAEPDTVLTLENDYKFTDSVISTGITISKSLTIDGNGYTIDALNKGRIFNVTSGPVTIKNLTIKNANGNNQGGVIHWSGGSGCVSNCTFLNCKSTQNGGTIYWTGYYGSVADSKFINCNSPNKDAGAIYWNGVNGTVDNCSFIKCSSKFGGAIYWGSYNGSLMNSHFEDCYSTSYGGAVDWVGSNGFIDNCTFKKCYSTDYGGAVYYQSLNAEIFNCKFLSCYSKSRSAGAVFWWDDGGLMKNCSFVDCSSISGGGGLYWSGAQGSVTNSSFESCSSTRGGGAIAWDKNKGNVSDCTFVKCFSHATATGGEGGAIYWNNAADSSVENSTFINCSASHNGGAIYWPSARGKVINCIFEGCNAALKKYGGGAIYWSGVGGSVRNSSFVKCHTEIDGGAIYWHWSATGGSVSDSRFEECFTGWFGNGGGGIYWYATSGSVNNCTFLKCTSEADGAGIYWNSGDGKLQNSTFDSCKADTRAGGLRWSGNNGFTYGCNFINCSSNNAGGIYWTGGSGSAFNITMVNCSAKTNGGGLYWSGHSGSVRKSDFEGCSADFGGAAYWSGKNGNVTDSIFMICSAKYGGAIHIYNTNVDVNNSYFENNSAYHSGAINIRASDVVVDNSNFTDNHVSHGGGAIGNYGEYPDKVNAVIRGSKFDNNRANNYGGALSLEYVLVDNSLFNDNSAVFGGAIYSISPEIINSRFNGCKALELGNDVFAINKSTIVNSNVLSENLYENNLTDSIIMVESGKITYNGYDYDVFAAESNIISPNGRTNDLYIADSSLKLLRNVVDSSDCSEYLKLILYNYSNNQLSRSEAVAMIRNGVYGNSPVPTEKAPVFEFVGNSVIVYDYISFITPSSNTNYYSVKKTNYILNQSITKVALNKTAFVGDIVEFSINFTNGNNFTLPDVFVKDVFDENEFEYLSFKSNDNWTYNSTSKIFTLSSLNSHNTSNLVLSFKVKTNATLNNTVYGGFKGSITCNNTTSIKTFNPVLNVEKSCLTPNVFLTQTAKFNITVKNNGDIDLHDIVLTEDNSKDLLFEGFYDYGLWDYSLINKKHTWKLLNPLAPGHASSLLVYFNTNASGRLINNVSVESSQTKGKFTAQDSVDVSRPEIKVEKIAVNPDVVLSDPAVFEIIVNNTSPVDLTGVSVCEDSYDGLVYDSFRASDSWIHSIIAGKHVWTFKENLLPGKVISFFTVFNTTGNGTFVNNVVASSDTSSSTQANATVNVLVPKFSVEKVALTQSVVLGSQAVYKIVINNTGETNLTNIVVEEYPDSFLVYDHFSDNGLFTHSIVNEKHVWNLNRLAKGDYAEFSVYFNTTASGRLVNNVSAESSQTKGKFTAQASVDVIRPEIKVEKIAVNPDVVLSESAVFEIIVNNTSPVTLTGVSVCEDSYDGLLYDSFRASDKWNHSIIAGKHVWTFKENLVPGEVISFFTLFNTTSNGTFVNNVVASSDTSSSARANATVNVLMPKFSVKKLALTQNVVLGSKAVYQIVIHNTGETDLTNIVVEEYPDSSLVYDHFTDNGFFTHSIVNEKHVWTLNKLAKGAYAEFSVYFNTTASGHILNNVSAESSQTKGKSTAQASVDVFRPEIKVEKIAVNPDVVLSKPAVFEIIVNNTSPVTLTGVSVCEDSYDGLLYDSFRASDSWNHSIIAGKHVWTFTENLLPGEVISFFTVFNTYRNGTFVNNVVVSSDTSSSAQANATVNVLVPKLSVEKVALTQSVSLGSQAVYEIVLHNAGETDLTNIVVEEYPDSSLVYDHFTDNGLFTHSIINEKHVWTLNKLTKGAYAGFLVYFNTTAAGNVTNRISVRSDEIKDTNASNTTNVLLPSFTVEKICLIPNVLVGNQTLFEVVIKNTGKVELTNVYFTEESFDGLIFDSAIGEAIWTHSIVKGKNTWILNEPLKGDAYIGLILKFNTTAAGNYTNIISAASNQTGVLIANATVHVFENKVPDPPEQNSSNNYSMEVFKIAVTPSVVLNDQITFQIIIHNTGKFNLNNVKVTELIPEGLIYSHFVDYLNIWTYNGDLTWSSNSSIYPGEYVGFYVTFNTTKDGVFTNIVNVAANNTNDSSSNASFNVLKPDFTVEKILVEDNILNGNQATFEIVVHNTGNAPLTGVTVREYDFKGLVYDHFTDYLDIWTYNGDLTWTMNTELLAGEYVALFVTFNTTDEGNFTNIVAADSNECEEKFSNATVSVFNENIDISMICLTPLVTVGNQAIFEITIQNTGKIPIDVLKLSEFEFDGLIYDHFIDYLGDWINDGLSWKLNTTLVPREIISLFIVFNTTKEGNFTNIVLANKDVFDTNGLLSANSLEEGIYVSAPVEVVKPAYAIEKVAINRTVTVGDEVIFEIIVHNICKVNIENVTVFDIPSDGLSYVGFVDDENFWSKNGDLSWNLASVLVPGQYSSFFVVFNATKAGVLENVIESGDLTSNASVEVMDVVIPAYAIEKVSINRTVMVGDEVIFEIIVHNIGNVNIDNVTVFDIPSDGLSYVGFVDDENFWSKNGDLSWNLASVLVPGQYSSFFVVFNATKVGILENVIESDNLTSKASVEVKNPVVPTNPDLILEAEVIYDPVTGKPVLKVTVINNGDVDLDNVFVKLNLPEGLKTGDYYSHDSIWNFNNDSFDLDGILKVDESKSFYIEIIGEPGEYNITVDAGYNATITDSAIVSVKILDNSTPRNDTNPITPEDNPSSKSTDKIIVDDNSTGNPLIMVLFALICFVTATLRKRK